MKAENSQEAVDSSNYNTGGTIDSADDKMQRIELF